MVACDGVSCNVRPEDLGSRGVQTDSVTGAAGLGPAGRGVRMSISILVLAATASGGALALWHAVSKAKHLSEGMLDEYARLLAEARQQKANELAAQRAQHEEAEEEAT